ncbi:hypothetical protein BD769DRAFT_1666289 [Suillus cothurnatus]|nr:hypothetical protein BD769DRAFT_1666289 [Suillus cothurnatus]
MTFVNLKEPKDRTLWVEDVCHLYHLMEKGTDRVHSTASTYDIMLLAWRRFNPGSNAPVQLSGLSNPKNLISNIVEQDILPTAVIILNHPPILVELGQVEFLASRIPDPLEGVPEVKSIVRVATPSEEILDENENVIHAQPQQEVPININNLRSYLAQVTLAQRVLLEDLASRQKLLEESVYNVAVESLRHEAKLFDELDLGNRELHRAGLQKWMWD